MIDENVIIGVDYGFGNIKTRNCCFNTGITEVSDSPITYDNILEYEGKCYQIGGDRIKIQDSKTINDDYYHLTIAAMDKELKIRGLKSGNVVLTVGLPIGRFAAEKKEFISYLNRSKYIRSVFEKKLYNITIQKVLVYPQCYGAVVNMLPELSGLTYVVDIGSWTIDILKIIDRTPDESGCSSEPSGVITCIKKIQEVCYEKMNSKLDEHLIKEYLIHGHINVDDEYIEIIDGEVRKYTVGVFRTLVESGINVKTSPIIFVGGGAALMRRYAGLKQKNITFVEDVCANAKGYETLASLYLSNRKGM